MKLSSSGIRFKPSAIEATDILTNRLGGIIVAAVMLLCLLGVSNVIASPYSEELDRSSWTTVDTGGFGHQEAFDGDVNSRWATGEDQRPGQTFTLALGSVQNVDRLVMITNNGDPNNADYPRGYEIHTSLDGFEWGDPVKTGAGSLTHTTIIDFVSQSAAYIRITQTGSAQWKWWSIFELKAFGTPHSAGHEKSAQLDMSGWSASASSNSADAYNAIDVSLTSVWTTAETQKPGQIFTVDMGVSKLIDQVVMVSKTNGGSATDYPRNIDLQLSQDGVDWSSAVSSRQGSYSGYTDIRFTKQPARFMRFTQTGGDAVYNWSIYNLMVFGSEDFSQGNQAPRVSFINPEDLSGADVEPGSDIRVSAQADDDDGYVQFVSLYINDFLVGQKSTESYEWDSLYDAQLQNLTEGTYVLRLEATDDQGAVGTATNTFVVLSSENTIDGRHEDIVTTLDRELNTIKGTPDPSSWADSYSVGDQCFCITDNGFAFDHGIGDYSVDTMLGTMTVRQACGLVGPGPGKEGRPLYNDIQCGNGPSNAPTNTWDDEDFCPGQVNVTGTETERRLGCLNIGPIWKFNVDETDIDFEGEDVVDHPDIVSTLEIDPNELSRFLPDPQWWFDSYSVDDQCFCKEAPQGALASKLVETSAGVKTVAEACALAGEGPGSEDRPRYNDIQCGNGPHNGNEDEWVCPGQVNVVGTEEQRRLGCRNIGPKWKIGTDSTTVENTPELHEDIVSTLPRLLSSVRYAPDAATWADSYSVGDQCYCITDNGFAFDHGIGDYSVDTVLGTMTVRQACGLVGPGPGKEGRPLYNDIQCGNGPSNAPTNTADDEDFCPGQVNVTGTDTERRMGCLNIGPTWKL